MTDLHLAYHAMTLIALTMSSALLAVAMLKGWNSWLALKRAELDIAGSRTGRAPTADARTTSGLIEMADLKERIRKLEAIAAGIDV